MTENKRFIMFENHIELFYFDTHQEYCSEDSIPFVEVNNLFHMSDEQVVEVLNKFYNENVELKQAYNKLKCYHSNLYDEFHDIEFNKDRYYKDVLSLEKENEQLKKELKKYTDAFDCSQCRFQNYDWFDDGDEFEVCEKGNNEAQMENHSCSEWELF